MASVAPAVQDFWVPVAQIVPVFALAVVLEARRSAARWTVSNRAERWASGIYYVGTALMLVAIEITAIGAMATGVSVQASADAAGLALVFVMILIVMGAVFQVMLSGVADLVLIAPRLLVLLIPRFRRNRKQVREWRTQLVADLAEMESANAEAVVEVEVARQNRRRLRQHVRELEAKLAYGSLNTATEAKLRKALKKFEKLRPRVERGLERSKELVERGRLIHVRGTSALAEADEYLRRLTPQLSEAEIKKLEDDWARFKTS